MTILSVVIAIATAIKEVLKDEDKKQLLFIYLTINLKIKKINKEKTMSKNIKPLTNEELLNVAPSIFSENPIEGVSDKYAFVPTYKLLDTFRDAGYYPIMAS